MVQGSDWYVLEEGDEQSFELGYARLVDGASTTTALAGFLLSGLSDPNYLRDLFARHGRESLEAYVAARRVPSRVGIRVADFGEITAGHLLEEEEALHRPIEKLRYKFNHEWSPQLTDVFAVRTDGEEIAAFAYCEVKAGTTAVGADVGADGYRALVRAWREKVPEILHFTSERLWEAGRYAEYEQLDRAIANATALPQLLRLVLVFDDQAWSDSVFDSLAEATNQDSAPGSAFKCYLVRRSELRSLIDAVYNEMTELARAV